MDINELRRFVKQRHDAATKKVSRLRRVKGVEVGGTNEDVRRDPRKLKRYTRAQLNTYLRKLNTFLSRRQSYIAGVEGVPLPGDRVRVLQKEIRTYNDKAREHAASVANIKLPGNDLTVAERAANMTPTVRRAGGSPNTRPFSETRLKPSNIPGVDALNKLIADFQRKNSPGYLSKHLTKQRDNAEKLLIAVGHGEHIELLRGLTDDQFDTVWNETSLPAELGMGSGLMRFKTEGRKNAAHDAVMENLSNDIAEQLTWASNLPPRQTQRKTRFRR